MTWSNRQKIHSGEPTMKFSATPFYTLLLVASITSSGCKGGSAEASSSGSVADISPASPTFNQEYQTRNPRVCAKVTHRPSVAEAAVMVQCNYEASSRLTGSSPGLSLATDVVVEMGAARSYDPNMDDQKSDIDPSARVYPLRGSSTSYGCLAVNQYNRNGNCFKSFGGGLVGQGACYYTSFKEWQCYMTMGGTDQALNVKGPTAF
jgi:hypothetical protein